MDKTKRGKCKGCGAVIIWIETPAGKFIPCNPAPVIYRPSIAGKGKKLVTPLGRIVSAITDVSPYESGVTMGYIPHWGTCPASDDFKLKVKKQEELDENNVQLRLG